MKNQYVQVREIFRSLQGESYLAGFPCGFIRLTGCNLRCGYCDTTFSYEGGVKMSFYSIMEEVRSMDVQYLCVTGGEPLMQKETPLLLHTLTDAGFLVSLETNGSLPLADVPEEVMIIADYKTKGSREGGSFLEENIPLLKPRDELKFVCSSHVDAEESFTFIRRFFPYREGATAEKSYPRLTLSPVFGQMEPAYLAELLLQSRLPHLRLQLQLHKLLWGERRGV